MIDLEVCPSCGGFVDWLDELTGWCVECVAVDAADSKRCLRCAVVRPFGDFQRRPDRPAGYRNICRACESRRRALWRLANRERDRAADHASYLRRVERRAGGVA